jgi:cellulose synthase/poly-beta-1,6-N-acetylglucosamine synthase-like glycosyltransferase
MSCVLYFFSKTWMYWKSSLAVIFVDTFLITPFIPKYLSPLTFLLTLIIYLIKKFKVIKIKYIFKLYYVINHIIFDFFITLIFLIRLMVKDGEKVKDNKYLGMEGVIKLTSPDWSSRKF